METFKGSVNCIYFFAIFERENRLNRRNINIKSGLKTTYMDTEKIASPSAKEIISNTCHKRQINQSHASVSYNFNNTEEVHVPEISGTTHTEISDVL